MEKLFIIIIILFTSSCKENPIKSDPMSIIVEVGQSYKFDISGGVYTIFFINKPTVDVRFYLTENEKKEIARSYHSLSIDDLKSNLELNDECNVMPKIYTVLHIKNAGYAVKFKIDEACNDFYFSNYRTAKNIKSFLNFIRNIVNQKVEVKNAPKSDIFYL